MAHSPRYTNIGDLDLYDGRDHPVSEFQNQPKSRHLLMAFIDQLCDVVFSPCSFSSCLSFLKFGSKLFLKSSGLTMGSRIGGGGEGLARGEYRFNSL